MKLSDYIVSRLADWGVHDMFLVVGGGSMHLNDSILRESRVRYICNHHEQAAAMAVEAYARISDHVGVLNVTTGPGGGSCCAAPAAAQHGQIHPPSCGPAC